jgi:hypothetical protein
LRRFFGTRDGSIVGKRESVSAPAQIDLDVLRDAMNDPMNTYGQTWDGAQIRLLIAELEEKRLATTGLASVVVKDSEIISHMQEVVEAAQNLTELEDRDGISRYVLGAWDIPDDVADEVDVAFKALSAAFAHRRA